MSRTSPAPRSSSVTGATAPTLASAPPSASTLTSTSVAVALQWGLHALIVGLGVLVVVRALSGDAIHPGAAIVLVAAFEAVYLAGAVLARRLARLRHLWVASLAVLWLGTVVLAPDAAFLAFPLFFLCLHLLRGWWGPLSVAAVAVVAIVGLAYHRGLTVGGVTGPLVGAGVAVAIGLGVRTLVREVRARERLVTRLLAAQSQLAETERAAGVEAERTRMAAELHDTVAQNLSSIQLLLSAAERRMGAEAAGLHEIALAKSSAASALTETRAFIRALNSPKLAAATLPDALARVVSETGSEASTAGTVIERHEPSAGTGVSEGTGVSDGTVASVAGTADAPGGAAEFVFRTSGTARALPRPVETTILRIVQGALGNAVTHAHADRVLVTLAYGHQRIAVDIVDDGRGFDPAAVRPSGESDSFGLDVMRARARAVGGALTVDSRPGEGTTVRAVFDVDEEASGER